MNNTITKIRFFTIADFNEEEIWLRQEHNNGLKLVKMIPPCFFIFESCQPEDVVYRLDFKNNSQKEDYMQMVSDYGWEYVGACVGWLYFRKPVSELANENDGEIFSDNASRSEMLSKVIRTRLLPLGFIFLCCVIPNARHAINGSVSIAFTVFWSVMLVIYVYLLVHCGIKLKNLKQELE